MNQIIFRLSEVSKLYAGGDAPKEVSSDRTDEFCYPIFSNGLDNEGLYGYSKKATMKANTITVSARGTIGAAFYRKEPFLPIVRLITIEPNEQKINSWYLYYYLLMNKLEGYGTSQQQLTLPFMKKKKVLIFENIDYQKKIATILYNYDQLIENNNKRIKLLEQMAEELYKEWFVRFRFPGYEKTCFVDGIPKGWEKVKLKDFEIELESGSRPSGGIDDTLNEGIPSLGAESIGKLGEFNYSSTKLISLDYYNKMRRGKSFDNAILLYKDGAYIGKTTIFRDKFPFDKYAINEHVFLVKCKNFIFQNYLYLTLHQPAYFSLMQILNKNSAQPGLSQPDVYKIKAIRPSINVVIQFNRLIEPTLGLIFNLAKNNRQLELQRDSLLPRLMSGKIDLEDKEVI